MNDDPVTAILDEALSYIRSKDPSWEQAQPPLIKAQVVELWKKSISARDLTTGGVIWGLDVGDKEFRYIYPMFADLDWSYNPYIKRLL